MLITEELLPDFQTWDELLNYEPDSCLFLDIETTGFSSASCMVFLIGILLKTDDGWKLIQYLAEKPEDEPALLKALFSAVQNRQVLIHFNGNTFDLPFLCKRAEKYKIPEPISAMASLDLYQIFRPLKAVLGQKHMNQITLEAFLNWNRTDRLTGKHMVTLFQKFAGSGEPQIRDLLLLHNHDDMIGMTKLLSLAYCLPLSRGRFREMCSYKVTENSCLEILLSLDFPLPDPVTYLCITNSELYRDFPEKKCTLQALSSEEIRLTLPLISHTMLHFFPNYKDYYYLPLEDQAIHKSVAHYVDKNYRRPATARNCYIKKEGSFLPQTEQLFSPVFRLSPEKKSLYFEFSENLISEKAVFASYLSSILRSFFQV